MEKGQRVLIVVHRQELIDQTVAALAIEGVPFGIIASGYREKSAGSRSSRDGAEPGEPARSIA